MTSRLNAEPGRAVLGMALWWPIAGFVLLSALLFARAGFTGGHVAALLAQLVLGMAVTRHLAERPGTARFGQVIGGFVMVSVFMSASLLLTHAAATPARPLVDAGLLAADRWLGYDWRAFIGFFAAHRLIALACVVAYNSHFLQPGLLALVLILTGRRDRFERLVLAFLLAMLATVAIFALWPVTTPWGSEGLTAAQLAPYRFPQPRTTGWEADFLAIRAGARVIPASFQAGLVSFPSFHCISALLFLWAAWPVRPLRWLLLPINAMMILAALFVGCHYLVDLIAGAVIAAIAAAAASRAYPLLIAAIPMASASAGPTRVALPA